MRSESYEAKSLFIMKHKNKETPETCFRKRDAIAKAGCLTAKISGASAKTSRECQLFFFLLHWVGIGLLFNKLNKWVFYSS